MSGISSWKQRTAADLVTAAEHAAVHIGQGQFAAARAFALVGRLRMELARYAAAREWADCRGRGLISAPCPPGCTDHDEPSRTGRHFGPCINVVAHPHGAADQ
ncbi:hypothetical protein ABZ502_17710 [Streptomyces abikoensis]|uniref:hypothetical protein n=1 Tax=Streptomyces abikoensis TaxID=97398 RepID=UPI00340F2B72